MGKLTERLQHRGAKSNRGGIAGGVALFQGMKGLVKNQIEPDWDLAAQPAPDDEVDQRVYW